MVKDIRIDNPALVLACKKVFGEDLVVDAWFMGSDYGNYYGNYKPPPPRFSEQDGCVDLSSENIVVQFSNGKKVLIWNSEWGGIAPAS